MQLLRAAAGVSVVGLIFVRVMVPDDQANKEKSSPLQYEDSKGYNPLATSMNGSGN